MWYLGFQYRCVLPTITSFLDSFCFKTTICDMIDLIDMSVQVSGNLLFILLPGVSSVKSNLSKY